MTGQDGDATDGQDDAAANNTTEGYDDAATGPEGWNKGGIRDV